MGITGILWDVLGDGEVIHIADYAARHFQQHKRPLRIAVDEACWRYTNLTPEQVQKIRDGEPAANPVEKTILWRILRLLKLNIQLHFVWDGPRKPWKRNKGSGGIVDREVIKLLHQMFDHLKVPYHQAPGEAEAECARLQQLGIVDAVWSDDGDALMFGCTTLIRAHKVGKERVKDYIRVTTAESILEKFDLDAESLLLFAMLSGGDYNTEGLRGCGPQSARLVARREHGLAKAACRMSQESLPQWRRALELTLGLTRNQVTVPPTFPDWKALCHYRNPAVSTEEDLQNLRRLRGGWYEQPIDQVKLRVLMRERFNFWTRGFLKHFMPLYLVRSLADAKTSEQRIDDLKWSVQLKRTRKSSKTDGDEAPAKSEVKLTFVPSSAVQIDLIRPPPEEDWSIWTGKDGSAYDPAQEIECEVLECLVHHGLPDGALDAATEPAKRKRKTRDSDTERSLKASNADKSGAVKRRKKASGEAEPDATANTAKKRGRPRKVAAFSNERQNNSKAEEQVAVPPRATFRMPRMPPPIIAKVVDLCDDSSESEQNPTSAGATRRPNSLEHCISAP